MSYRRKSGIPHCSECQDCQKMIGNGVSFRCYGQDGFGELKKDIGIKMPETSPQWCPKRKKKHEGEPVL